MRRIDALANEHPERFQLLTGRALSPELDEALQAIVRSLAVDLKAPIALVSLVFARTSGCPPISPPRAPPTATRRSASSS